MTKVLIDFTGCKYYLEFFRRIIDAFDFPFSCAENWSAIWDCLDYYYEEDEEVLIQIMAVNKLPKAFRERMPIFINILEDLKENTPKLRYEILS